MVFHCCRRNQALAPDCQQLLDQTFPLQQESKALSPHLNALLNDKFGPQDGKRFDSDTPIDKALMFLQFIIAVWSLQPAYLSVRSLCVNTDIFVDTTAMLGPGILSPPGFLLHCQDTFHHGAPSC